MSGARCLVPETMTHLADKLIPVEKETEVYSNFENFENGDIIAAVLAFRLVKKFKRKSNVN